MCTLILAWHLFPDTAIVAAANRDEYYDRPADPPAVRPGEPPFVAPLDEQAGGTWIGYNAAGVFTAITNRWVDGSLGGDRSRGLLVRDLLAKETAETAARHVERAVEADEYDGFNLVIADADAALYLEWDGQLRVRTWEPGIHVVVNVGADGTFTLPAARQQPAERQAEGARRAHTTLRPEPGEGVDAWLDRATEVLRDHDYGLCVHGDGFGTRSSSLVLIGEEGSEFRHAEGPPCETAYETVRGSDLRTDGQI